MTASNGSMSHDDVRRLAGKLIGAGFRVFPTLHKKGDPNDKKPGGDFGVYAATNDPPQFENLLRGVRIGSGWHLGLGVYPGASGHIVLDPDVKDGGRGLESLAGIESVYGPLPGRRVRTPSGGLHIWNRLPDGYIGEIGNKKAWPDIDTRCHNGYVIAPGVFLPWGSWTPESGTIGQIPAGVLAEIEAAHTEPKKIPTEATPGDRHESLVSIAASYWAKGLNRDAVLHGIRGYNAEQCKPPKPDSELVDIVNWVVQQEGGPQPKYEIKLPGRTGESSEEEQPSALEVLTLAELGARVDAAGPRKYLIRGIWPSDAYGVLAGPMKAQKTMTMADAAVSVASATLWLNHYPIDDPGPVLMFAGEGGAASIVRRLRAVCDSRDLDPGALPVHICTRAPHLRSDEHMGIFAEKIGKLRPKLVVLDPLYLSAAGAKSGDLYGMGELLERAQLICDSIGSALMVVTHFNRGNRTGAERITGAGPAEWGRVLIGVDVKSRHTDPETMGTTVVTAFDVIGGEVPDQSWRVKRHIVADDPDSLDSPLRYSVEVIESEDDRADDDMPPARRKLLEAVNAVGGPDGATNSQLVDWIADKYGHGLTRSTVSTQLNELARSGLVDSIESPGSPTLWLPSQGVAGVVTTPTEHLATGDTERVLSLSSRLKDDNTPTPRNDTLDLSPHDAETERIAP